MAGKDSREESPRTVPLDLLPMLRAPYGWTNRMRRAEGYPGLGAGPPVRVGLMGNLVLAVSLYGLPVAGGVVGWQVWGAWSGVLIGVLMAMVVVAMVAMIVAVIVALVRS